MSSLLRDLRSAVWTVAKVCFAFGLPAAAIALAIQHPDYVSRLAAAVVH